MEVNCDIDHFKYFQGGRQGIQKRLGELFREKLAEGGSELVGVISEETGVTLEILKRISDGDYSGIKSQVALDLSLALNVNYQEAVRGLVSPGEDRDMLLDRMRREQYVPTGGVDSIGPREQTPDRILHEYLTRRALREL